LEVCKTVLVIGQKFTFTLPRLLLKKG